MTTRNLVLLDAPSNLGLRPPEPGAVPGCYKAPGVFRDLGLLSRLGAIDAGVVTPPRYLPDWTPGTVRNEAAIAAYSRQVANRVTAILERDGLPVVLGGDCSIVIGVALALHRRGRFGLVYLDGLDYRHDGPDVGSAGGESLALVTGLGGQLAELDGTRPYLRPRDTVVVGLRPGDEYAGEAAGAGLHLIDAPTVRRDPVLAADQALRRLEHADLDGFWVHIDADVIDGELLRAVDSPEPDGLTFDELATVVRRLLASPRVVGVDVTIYDPDRDTDLHGGQQLTDALVKAFAN
jgi:arginase